VCVRPVTSDSYAGDSPTAKGQITEPPTTRKMTLNRQETAEETRIGAVTPWGVSV